MRKSQNSISYILKEYLEKCSLECPNARRWQSNTIVKILVGYEEGVYEYGQNANTDFDAIPVPILRTLMLTSIAFTGTSFLPSFNASFETIAIEPSKTTMMSLLIAVNKIFMWYESIPVPNGSGADIYRRWSQEKRLEKVLNELKNDELWNRAVQSTIRQNAHQHVRKVFLLYFGEIGKIWTDMANLSLKSSNISKLARSHFGATIKASCYVGFLFKTIVFRLRNYGIGYLWETQTLKKLGVSPILLSDVFTNFEGPYPDERVVKPITPIMKPKKVAKLVKPPTPPTSSTPKKRKVASIEEPSIPNEKKKIKKKQTDGSSMNERERAKFKTLEAKVGIISHALSIALEKLERLSGFVESIANKVTT